MGSRNQARRLPNHRPQDRRADGGLELPPKKERLGHASIVITMDTYGHLFPRGDDGAELAAAEKFVLA